MRLEGRSWLVAWDGWALDRSGEADRGEDKGRDLLGLRCTWLTLEYLRVTDRDCT